MISAALAIIKGDMDRGLSRRLKASRPRSLPFAPFRPFHPISRAASKWVGRSRVMIYSLDFFSGPRQKRVRFRSAKGPIFTITTGKNGRRMETAAVFGKTASDNKYPYPFLSIFLIRKSTTAGSARVDVSPMFSVSPEAIFLRMRLMILPDRVLGRALVN